MRSQWLSRRAVTFHVLVAIIVPFCLFAGWWQVNRALSGNLLSYAYSVEWPAFAIIAIIGWWQLIHEDPAEVVARKEERARRAGRLQPAAEAVSGGLGAAPGGNEADDTATGSTAVADVSLPPASVGATVTETDDTPDEDDLPADTLSAYNAYLRRLAQGGQRKTWRNPRGLPS